MQLRNGRQLFPLALPSASLSLPVGLGAPVAAVKRKSSPECSDDQQQKQKQQQNRRHPKVWSDIGIETLINARQEHGAVETSPQQLRPSKAVLLLGAGAENISAPQQPAVSAEVAAMAGTALAPATPGQATPPVPAPPRPGVLWGQAELQAACDALAAAEPRLRPLMEQHGLPVRLLRKGGSSFATLSKSICFQQVTTAAGAAIFGRLLAACGCAEVLTPAAALATEVLAMRAAGLSERKASYIKDLASHFHEGHLSDEALAEWDDAMLHARLTAVKVGRQRGRARRSSGMFICCLEGADTLLPSALLSCRAWGTGAW